MGVMAERVRALKIESAATGGDAADEVAWPEPIDIAEDYLDAQGLALQEGSSNDETVLLERASNRLKVTDELGNYDPRSVVNKILLTEAGTVVYIGAGDILQVV